MFILKAWDVQSVTNYLKTEKSFCLNSNFDVPTRKINAMLNLPLGDV